MDTEYRITEKLKHTNLTIKLKYEMLPIRQTNLQSIKKIMKQVITAEIRESTKEKFIGKIWKSWLIQPIFWKTLVILSHGFVLMLLWRWYVSRIFGFDELTFVQASGIVLIVNLVTQHNYSFFVDPTITKVEGLKLGMIDGSTMSLDVDPERRKGLIAKSITFQLLRPVAYLLIGWVLHFLL